MQRIRCSLALVLAMLMAAPAVQAQSHVISRAALDKAVQDRVARDQADREVILSVLRRAEVKEIASRAGLPIDKAAAAVPLLQGRDLQEAASHARQVQDDLAGGANVVISTTTIIIVLLLVILIVLIAD